MVAAMPSSNNAKAKRLMSSSQNETAGLFWPGRKFTAKRACRVGDLFPLRHRQIFALRRTGIELARTAELLVRILDHFLPLRDPADGAGEREQHREHRGREAHRAQRDAGIEVDVRIELLLDEIIVVQC